MLEEKMACFHCGDNCNGNERIFNEKSFCCDGCVAVYQLFVDTDLEDIYAETNRLKPKVENIYDYLDNIEISNSLLDFQSAEHNSFRVKLPAIHCSSCIYLLEHLSLFHKGIIKVSVNFGKQEADIHYNPKLITLKEVSTLLDRLGYAPQFNRELKKGRRNDLSVKIGVAAFCFGNIMMLSFPEYLGIEDIDAHFKTFFSYINILLALPVLLYSAQDYFISAYKGLRSKFINIDVPIAIGIVVLFTRSVYEILAQSGAGYLDSLAGLVFFLLIGKWFQNKTYEHLSFERDYKSYFPLASTVITEDGLTKSIPISDLVEGDIIQIRNQEIIPADAVLLSEEANIDYSFVTGEEKPELKKANEQLFAGGRQIGPSIQLKILKPSSQSYLTSLWNNQVFKKETTPELEGITNSISKYFTIVILAIAVGAGIFWYVNDTTYIWQVITAVLIVACPCALALSAPFSNGNVIRVFGNNKFYLKNASRVEKLSEIDTLVFDKTGTLTEKNNEAIQFVGKPLTGYEETLIGKLTENSIHPLSRGINENLKKSSLPIHSFEEIPGQGLYGEIDGHKIKLGNAKFTSAMTVDDVTSVFLNIDGSQRGYFTFGNKFRDGISQLTQQLDRYKLVVLSGDNDSERKQLEALFPENTTMHFGQQPQDKLDFIKNLQQQNRKVLMLGDGLNDAGALKQSDVGIAVTEDVSTFSPACDGIMEGSQLKDLADYLAYAKQGKKVILSSFTISFLYNAVGLGFAVSGALTPIFAAILMPISSISVVGFTTFMTNYLARKKHLI